MTTGSAPASDKQFLQGVQIALDCTLAEVGKWYMTMFEAFGEGGTRKRKDDTRKRIGCALDELMKLQDARKIPNYDDYFVALFYALWYQPLQINTAFSLISKHQHAESPFEQDLHVIDFGSGAGAMRIGVALTAANSFHAGQEVRNITLHEIDNHTMQRLANRIWIEFKKQVESNGRLGDLDLALSAINVYSYKDHADLLNRFGSKQNVWARYWLSALHVAYEDNEKDVKDVLSAISKEIDPDKIFLSTANSKRRCLERIAQAQNVDGTYFSYDYNPLKTRLDGSLDALTELRREINLDYFKGDNGLLNSQVKWSEEPNSWKGPCAIVLE